MNSIAVIGVGQSLRGDDGAGLAAVRQWQERFMATASRPEVRCEACEAPGLELLELLSQVRYALFVDAIQSTKTPGTIHLLDETKLAAFDHGPLHGWGLAETLQLSRTLANTQLEVKLVGVAAADFTIGSGLSMPMRAALPAVSEQIEKIVQGWL